jgi:hypothetical protein
MLLTNTYSLHSAIPENGKPLAVGFRYPYETILTVSTPDNSFGNNVFNAIVLSLKLINYFPVKFFTFLMGKTFLPRGLSLSPREKYFHHGQCHFHHGKNISTTVNVTFTTGKIFPPRSMSLSPREKYFYHGQCHFYQGKNIFTTDNVTFTMGKIFSPWTLSLLPWSLSLSPRSLLLLPWSLLQCCRLMIK